jgi:DNA invertase Pin-like site-specific DNA recombinase
MSYTRVFHKLTNTLYFTSYSLLASIYRQIAGITKYRQIAGITKAKQERPESYQGRRATTDGSEVKELLAKGIKPVEVPKKLGISRATVYRYK